MAAHAHLKNEFTEDEKYHNLMSWLIYLTDTDGMANSVDPDQTALSKLLAQTCLSEN